MWDCAGLGAGLNIVKKVLAGQSVEMVLYLQFGVFGGNWLLFYFLKKFKLEQNTNNNVTNMLLSAFNVCNDFLHILLIYFYQVGQINVWMIFLANPIVFSLFPRQKILKDIA